MSNQTIHASLQQAEAYYAKGEFEKAESAARELLRDAQLPEHAEYHARTLILVGESLRKFGNRKEALKYLQEALKISETFAGKEFRLSIIQSIGTTATDTSDYHLAIESLEQSISLARDTGNSVIESAALGGMGNVYKAVGDFVKALHYFEEALEVAKKSGNEKTEVQWVSAIGIVYQNLQEFPRALEYFSAALALSDNHGMQDRLATCYGNMGIVHANLGNVDMGLEYMNRAMQLDAELDNKSGAARHLGNLGSLHLELKQPGQAMQYLKKALALDEELSNKSNVVAWQAQIGAVYADSTFEDRDESKAEQILLQSLEQSNLIEYRQLTLQIHYALSDLYEMQQRWKEHAQHYKAYHLLEKQLQSEEVAHRAQQLENRRKLEEAERDRQVKLARFQEQEKILHNILPAQIAEQIVNGEEKIIQRYDNASVLFADVVGFTKLSEGLSLKEVAETLNRIFNLFDELATEFGVEKIKTIGDAYMCVSGMPEPCGDHAERMAKMALAMNYHLQLLFPDKRIKLRIGIHCGEVIAGVLGKNKYAYDLWGDTVNTASRMESHGIENKIQVSNDFKEHLDGKFQFEERGEIEVKGKGKMKTYFLTL